MSIFFPNFDDYRCYTRGNYDTDFSSLTEGEMFPSLETRARNRVYRFNHKLYTGQYCHNKNLLAMINGVQQEINYKVIPLNYFELIVNKLDSLLFGNEVTIKTGDIKRDELVNNLVERTAWMNTIREAVKLAEIYGDSVIKTGRFGASAFSPEFAYKVVNISNKKDVRGYVLHELIYEKDNRVNGVYYEPTYIRLLICCNGFEYERVFQYFGDNKVGRLGKPVRYKYKNRWIPKSGRYYNTDVDCNTVQWLSVNTEKDGVYGTSSFDNIKELVFAMENRLSTENWVVDEHGKPLLIVGMGHLQPDEYSGGYIPRIVNGKYLLNMGEGSGFIEPKYIEWDGKLDASQQIREDIMSSFYELSEMGKTFLSGEYSGNISEESLNNIIKSAIDRGNREINSIWYDIRQSLYVLCRLNDIDINIEDINIQFNVGRTDDDKQIAEICGLLTAQGILSKQTVLNRYFGYNEDQALAELERIKIENTGGVGDNDTNGKVETVIRE